VWRSDGRGSAPDAITEILRSLDPLPAVVTNARFDILEENEFAELWALHEVAEFQPRVRTFIHPDAGPLRFTTSELQVLATPEARLVVYTPAEDDTRARLPLTRCQDGAQDLSNDQLMRSTGSS
jgi:hypothetical protein